MQILTNLCKLLSEVSPPAHLLFLNPLALRKMATTYITKAQRQNLIDQYEECAEDMGEEFDRARLESLNNTALIAECKAFMPDCMDSL